MTTCLMGAARLRTIAIEALVFFSMFVLNGLNAHSQNYTHIVEAEPDRFLMLEPASFNNLEPGDTICLLGGDYLQILVRDIHGRAGAPIVIRNKAGIVHIQNTSSYGVAFHGCSYIKLLGNGDDRSLFGIRITGTAGNGISVDRLSTNVEIAHVEVANTSQSGIMIKTDPGCDDLSSVRYAFTLHEAIVHHNYIHHTGNEGLYIGSSYYYPGFPMHCNGKDTLVLPHEIITARVFDNILEHTGRNSIQLSSVVEDCQIYNNIIIADSQRAISYHMNGIQVGGGSCCDVFNNKIIDGKGSGIHYFGKGPARLFNNLIVNPGRDHHPELPPNEHPVHGILVKHIYADTPDPIHLFHNTIVNPRSDAIRFENPVAENSHIQNNLLLNPGSFGFVKDDAFIHVSQACTSMVVSHNFFGLHVSDVYFADTLSYDFSLTARSPAINKGTGLGAYGIDFDLDNQPRPYGLASDIGAYEFQGASPTGSAGGNGLYIFPNPASDHISFFYSLQHRELVRVTVYDEQGKLILDRHIEGYIEQQRFPVSHLAAGLYHILVQSKSVQMSGTFIKI